MGLWGAASRPCGRGLELSIKLRQYQQFTSTTVQMSADVLNLARQLAGTVQDQLQQTGARELRTLQELEKQRDDARQRELHQ